MKLKLIKNLLMNAPISLTMSVLAQLLNIAFGHADSFVWSGVGLGFAFSYAVAFVVGWFIPSERWGVAFAKRVKAKENTFQFGLCVALVVNTVFTLILCTVMTWFFSCVLGGAPLIAIPGGVAEMILPMWIACFIVSLLIQKPVMELAKKLNGMQ